MAEENARFAYDEYDFSLDEGRASINGSFTLTGAPILTLTAGIDTKGLPFGINLIGPYKRDLELLSYGLSIEQQTAEDPELVRPLPDLARLVA